MNPFDEKTLKELKVGDNTYKYYSLSALNDPRVDKLPISIRVLLESALRNANTESTSFTEANLEKILDWKNTSTLDADSFVRIQRVLLQDLTGVACVVDLAAMRDAVNCLGGDPAKINPLVPVDLVVDHSVQVDQARSPLALKANTDKEMERNVQRFEFLKWGSKSFDDLKIVPPSSGIVHQINLEYLARVVFNKDGLLYPDTVVGTDSHTTMINGLGVVGFGVGGIEAQSVMLGQPLAMVLPQVVGFKLVGEMPSAATATDVVLTCTAMLRKLKVVGKFVEFYGPGVKSLSLADRATIANMAPEYGATIGFFPIDNRGIDYLKQTGRDATQVAYIEEYLKAQKMFMNYDETDVQCEYSETIELDLSTVVPTLAGPKRPHDPVPLTEMKKDFQECLVNPVGFKGYGLTAEEAQKKAKFTFEDKEYELTTGSVVIAAITSCTNTSNPSVLIGAGLVAKKAVEKGLTTLPYIKTSLAPGSHVATKYLEKAGLNTYLDKLGFYTVGYGCTTCIGNSGDIPAAVEEAINDNGIVASAVLSGNRNFEGRVHPSTRANYLASPPLVVAYALAGTVDIDFETTPIGKNAAGEEIYFKDIWPTREEIAQIEKECVTAEMFAEVYSNITEGAESWRKLEVSSSQLYPWSEESTYIHKPPYFAGMQHEPAPITPIENARALLNLGDSITTDHISPAGKIAPNSPVGLYLTSLGVKPADFNSLGARRGNDLVMMRGTFANNRIVNKLLGGKASAKTLYVPTKEEMFIYDAAAKYKEAKIPTIILGGEMYGSGSSRDWAAKGPMLQGVRAVIAQSFERIHRSNLIGMSVLPLQFLEGQSADSLGLTGMEEFTIVFPEQWAINQEITVKVAGNDKITEFKVKSRIDTAIEIEYYKHGGILHYVIRQLIGKQ